MLNKIGLIGLATASAALVFFACGGEGGGEDIRCTADTDCRVGEICHPDAKVCVQTCTSSADCPDASKTCAPLVAGDTSGTQICKCTTTPLCQGGPAGATSVCSDQYDVCVPSCTGDTDCPSGQTCNTATSTCVGGTTGCTNDTDCASGQTCNTTTGMCQGAATTCDSTQPQPAACAYGDYCVNNVCADVPTGTCNNFTGSGHGKDWDPATDMGPVITLVEKSQYQAPGNAFCGAASNLARYKVRVEAYDPQGGFPSANCTDPGAAAGAPEQAIASILHRVQPDGMEITMGGVQCVSTTNNGRNATFYVNYCAASTTGYSAGLHFVNGNEFCANVSAN